MYIYIHICPLIYIVTVYHNCFISSKRWNPIAMFSAFKDADTNLALKRARWTPTVLNEVIKLFFFQLSKTRTPTALFSAFKVSDTNLALKRARMTPTVLNEVFKLLFFSFQRRGHQQ